MELDEEYAYIFFDGVCNFCNSTVNYVIRKDKQDYFRFVPIQEPAGQALCKQLNIDPLEADTFILYDKGIVYKRSTAALRISRKLSGPIKLLYGFIIIPRFLRDGIYRIIAKNRYKWFGKKDSCMIPDSEVRDKFLTSLK